MSSNEICAQYAEALRDHLAQPEDELGLNRAYEIGRKSIDLGMGLLDMALLHYKAIHLIFGETLPVEAEGRIVAISNFFAECISPYEMLLRGFHEKNEQLQERTADLEVANQSLKEINDELESFSYSVSHDLRAPLRAIDGFSFILQESYAERLDAEGRRLIQVVRDGAQKMAQLIDDVLAYAHLARRELVTSVIDMNGLVEATLVSLQPAFTGRAIEMKVAPLPDARGDREMIQRVWLNLLDNAIKFTARNENAAIEVGAYKQAGYTIYFVKDNGVGFSMQYVDKLFGVFQRLHGSEDFPGTGAGLAIVKRIVSRLGGRVWAEGKIGEGAAFYFAVPASESGHG